MICKYMGWSYPELLATDDDVVAAVIRMIEKDTRAHGDNSR